MLGLFCKSDSFPFLTNTSISAEGKIRFNSEMTGVAKITSPKKAVWIISMRFTLQRYLIF